MVRRRMEAGPSLFGEGELADVPSKIVTDAQAIWNEYAEKFKWGKCQVLDKGRRVAIARAVQDYGGLVGWKANLEKVTRNRFLMGRVPPKPGFKQFKADIDWFIRPVTVRKVIEDFYEADFYPQAVESLAKQMAPQDEWSRWLRDYKLKGFWPTTMGPRPEDHRCRAPAVMLAACRERLGIVVTAPVVETKEQRLESMIVSYRNAGHYDRSNQLEEELARLQGRPPVLVPAPEVARIGMDPQPEPAPGGFWKGSKPRADVVARRLAARMEAAPVEYEDVPEGDDFGGGS